MRILILAGVAAAALTLTACNREEPAKATTDTSMAADSGSMSSDNSGGAMSSGSTSGSTSSPMSSDGATAGDGMSSTPPADSPVTEATREGAKEKAESTNLQPPTN
ncbi:MAG: hypothetical protein V4707_04190 [Pseudomonadota bacterium]